MLNLEIFTNFNLSCISYTHAALKSPFINGQSYDLATKQQVVIHKSMRLKSKDTNR